MKLSDYLAINGDREIDCKKLDEVLQIKKNKIWEIVKGDEYWFLDRDGEIGINVWWNNIYNSRKYEIGNIFPTEEAAQAHVEYLKTRAALKHYAQEHNEGEIDWDNVEQDKWYIYYNYFEKKNKISCTNNCLCASQTYFTSREIAQAAIKEIGDLRIKRYLLYDEEKLKINLCDHSWCVFKERDQNGKIISIYKCEKCKDTGTNDEGGRCECYSLRTKEAEIWVRNLSLTKENI